MRRNILRVVGLYGVVAIASRIAERVGLSSRLRCACTPECWCKRPSLTVFRWTTPKKWHALIDPDDKRTMGETSGPG
jgi:hypothetical protein